VRNWLKEAIKVWFDDGKDRTRNGRNNKRCCGRLYDIGNGTGQEEAILFRQLQRDCDVNGVFKTS
jgi:hypothetical protein